MIATPAPPQALQAERAVLAAMMLGPAAVTTARRLLRGAEFYRLSHRKIFEATLAVADRKQGADLVTVADELKRRGDLDVVGGAAYLAGVFEEASGVANLEAHAELVARAARQRDLLALSAELSELARATDDPDAVSQEFAGRLRELAGGGTARARRLLDAFDASLELKPADLPKPVRLLGKGLICRGDLCVFAGQPGLGKSRLALEMAVGMTQMRGWMGYDTGKRPLRVAYLALEFSNYHWMKRCVDIFTPGALEDEEPESEDVHRAFYGLPFIRRDGGFRWLTREMLSGGTDLVSRGGALELRTMVEALSPDLVIFDALSRSMGNREESNEEFKALVENLDDIRYSTGAALMFIHHEKKVDDRSKATPLSLLRGGTMLPAGVNTVLAVSETPGGLRSLDFIKLNYAQKPETIYYRIPDDGSATLLVEAPGKTADRNIEAVRAMLHAHPAGVTAKQVASATGLSADTAARHLKRIEDLEGDYVERVKLDFRTTAWRVKEDRE